MIGKNLGKLERWVRLAMGLLLAAWVIGRPGMGIAEWVGSVSALFLVLNGIYGRCYLWHVMDISSCGCNDIPAERFCSQEAA